MNRRAPRSRIQEYGAAMVEMAFVLPLFFLLCWGFMVFSFVLFGYCNATYASKMAARYAAYHGSSSASPCTSAQLQTIALQYLWGAPSGGVTVTSTWPYGNIIYQNVTVNIKVVYPTGIPFSTLKSVTIGTKATEVILE